MVTSLYSLRRINDVLMPLLTEYFLLQENIKNYERSLMQNHSTPWLDRFWALSEIFTNFMFPEEKRANDDWNTMMIEIKVLRMEIAFLIMGKLPSQYS